MPSDTEELDDEEAPRQQTPEEAFAAEFVAGAVEIIGDRWTMLILDHSIRGATKFNEWCRRLNISPDVLTRRLEDLVTAGLMEKRPYRAEGQRERVGYYLTALGRDAQPVLIALEEWAQRNDIRLGNAEDEDGSQA